MPALQAAGLARLAAIPTLLRQAKEAHEQPSKPPDERHGRRRRCGTGAPTQAVLAISRRLVWLPPARSPHVDVFHCSAGVQGPAQRGCLRNQRAAWQHERLQVGGNSGGQAGCSQRARSCMLERGSCYPHTRGTWLLLVAAQFGALGSAQHALHWLRALSDYRTNTEQLQPFPFIPHVQQLAEEGVLHCIRHGACESPGGHARPAEQLWCKSGQVCTCSRRRGRHEQQGRACCRCVGSPVDAQPDADAAVQCIQLLGCHMAVQLSVAIGCFAEQPLGPSGGGSGGGAGQVWRRCARPRKGL